MFLSQGFAESGVSRESGWEGLDLDSVWVAR